MSERSHQALSESTPMEESQSASAALAEFPASGRQMALNFATGLGLDDNESFPDLFQPYGDFPDSVRVENGHITMRACRASGSRATPISTRRSRRRRRELPFISAG